MRFLKLFEGIPRVLRITLVCLAVTVIVSQTALIFDTTRHFLTAVDILDGAVPASAGGIISTGTVTLRLTSGRPNDKIAILVNGDRYATFDKQTVDITITNQSVIEVVNDSNDMVEVAIENISDNLYTTNSVPKCTVDNLAVICRVVFKS